MFNLFQITKTRIFTPKYYLILSALCLFLLNGCSRMNLEDFSKNEPSLVLENYFHGDLEAWGILVDIFGNIRTQFYVKIKGKWDGEHLKLIEDYEYSSGKSDQRIWKIKKIGENEYVGTANDIKGKVYGKTSGNAFTWEYSLKIPVGKYNINARMSDWMWLQKNGALINKTKIKKFGITIAQTDIFFYKK